MPPKTKATAEEVRREIQDRIGQDCLPFSHFIDVQGNCQCGTYSSGDSDWMRMIRHLQTFAPVEVTNESD